MHTSGMSSKAKNKIDPVGVNHRTKIPSTVYGYVAIFQKINYSRSQYVSWSPMQLNAMRTRRNAHDVVRLAFFFLYKIKSKDDFL